MKKTNKKMLALLLCCILTFSGLKGSLVFAAEDKNIYNSAQAEQPNIEQQKEQEASTKISDTEQEQEAISKISETEQEDILIDENADTSIIEVDTATEESKVIAEISDVDTFDVIKDLENNILSETDARFSLMRLIVLADEIGDTAGAANVVHYEQYNEYVLCYDSIAKTKAAYDRLVDIYGEDNCFPDEVLEDVSLEENDEAESFGYQDYILKEDAQLSSVDVEPDTCLSWGAEFMGFDYLKAATDSYEISDTVTVAIIDSGVDVYEGDGKVVRSQFKNRIDYVNSYNFVDDNLDIMDGLSHGTHVAGIIADQTPDNVKLEILRCFDNEGKGATTLVVRNALQKAIDSQANVINMSLGFKNVSIPLFDDLIETACNQNIVVCCAAGNDQADVNTNYPAENPQTISVSAVNKNMVFAASYSNYGSGITFCAPGSAVESTVIGGELGTKNGTSMACPHMAAAVAYIKLIDSTYTNSQVMDLLKDYAIDLGDAGWDQYYGYGFVCLKNLYKDMEIPEKDLTDTGEGNQDKDATGTDARAEAELSFKEDTVSAIYELGGSFTNPVTTNHDGQPVYLSSDDNVVTVDEEGTVQIKGAGTAVITVTYSDSEIYKICSRSYNVNINAKDIKSLSCSLTQTEYVADGTAHSPGVYVMDGDAYISAENYSVTYVGCIKPGIGQVIIAGKGNYTGYTALSYTIQPADTKMNYIKNVSGAIQVAWDNVPGADGYVVYRRTAGTGWKKLRIIEDSTAYGLNDNTITPGVTYAYTVRAFYGDVSTLGGYDSTGLVMRYLVKPYMAKANTSSGIYLVWTKSVGASGYRIYRKVNGASTWTYIKNITTNSTSWTDKNVTAGYKYTYTIRAYYKNALDTTYFSAYYDPGFVMYRLTPREIYGISNVSGKKISLKWYRQGSATGYLIQYSTTSSFSSYKSVNVVGPLKYSALISGLTKGKYYYVRVRDYKTVDGVNYFSPWGSVRTIKITK